MPPSKKITSWSFSRLFDYLTCPLKAKLKHVDRLKEPSSPALERGADIHDKAEFYVKGSIKPLPKELKAFEKQFKELRAMFKAGKVTMAVEQTWAFTAKWAKTTWDDWDGCWVRIKLDLAHFLTDGKTVLVIDYKTGKFKDDSVEAYLEQLELYALGALLIYPAAEVVRPQLWYLDLGLVFPSPEASKLLTPAKGRDYSQLQFTRKDLPALLKKWEKKVQPMMKDTRFAPRPGQGCRWCFFSASKSGNCKF